MWYNKRNDKKKIVDMMNTVVGKHYNLEIIGNNNYLSYVTMSHYDLKEVHLKKYNKAKLMNINGLGIGQVHFLTEDGEYLLIPWCYVVSMIPSKEEVKNKLKHKEKN